VHIITSDLKGRVIELKRRNVPDANIRVALKEILQDYALAGIYSDKVFELSYLITF
jgi:hypothetical protein